MSTYMTLDLASSPPQFVPKSVGIINGSTVNFKTSDDSNRVVEIQPPSPALKFDMTIPEAFTPADGVGVYTVTYAYKGGATTGTVNVGVGGSTAA